jgi:hypothetical protein
MLLQSGHDLIFNFAILDNQKFPGLGMESGRSPSSHFDNPGNVFIRHRVGLKLADGPSFFHQV